MHVFKNEFLGFMRGCSGSTDKVGKDFYVSQFLTNYLIIIKFIYDKKLMLN